MLLVNFTALLLCPRKEAWYTLNWSLDGPRDSVNGCGEEKNLLPLRGREIFLFQFFIRTALSSAPLVLPPQRSEV